VLRRRRQFGWDDIQARAARAPARRRRRIIAVLVVALAASIAVVTAGYTGRGPYAELVARQTAPDETTATTVAGGTTSIEFLLDGRTHDPGDCVRWDQDAPPAVFHRTDVVDCVEEHLIEIARLVEVPGSSEQAPTDDEWDAIKDRHCQAVVEEYFGGKVDPYGRFAVGMIKPSDDSWRRGQRRVSCGLQASQARPREQAEPASKRFSPFRGEARASAQFWTFEPGNCIGEDRPDVVSCQQSHIAEVVGTLTLPDDTVLPSPNDREGWDAIVRDDCTNRAVAYLGTRQVPDPWDLGHRGIAPESWAAGLRTVPCFLGQWDDRWLPVTGSARGQSA
jgi:hypothetical protein